MKSHIESVLSTIAYVGAPGKNTSNFFADAAMELPFNSIYFEAVIFEILGWRGYNVTLQKMVNKSTDFDEILHDVSDQIASHPDLIHNPMGHKILLRVPMGKLVVSKEGKVASGGSHFNLNIDSEDGDNWHILDNPYEKIGPEKRHKLLQYMNVGLDKYHPGADEISYKKRLSDADPYMLLERSYVPDGPSVRDYYSVSSPNRFIGSFHNLPKKLDPGGVVYSPQTGQAFDSKFWPMEGLDYDSYDWYLFNGSLLSDDERSIYHPISGLSPDLIPGVSSGLVQSEPGLDVSSGFLLNRKRDEEHSGYSVIPEKIPSPSFMIDELSTPEWKRSYVGYKDKMSGIFNTEDFSAVEIPDLRGFAASFSSRVFDYEKKPILLLSSEYQYDAFGGPKGWSGRYINVRSGVSKINMLAASVSVMRNRDLIVNGSQTVVVLCPNRDARVWQAELGRLMGENVVIIDGADESRIDQWSKIIDKADGNNLPRFLVVTPSKFSYVRSDYGDDDQDISEMRIDYDHLRLLSVGGKHGKTSVSGNRVSVLAVDEVSEYSRPGSTRNKFLRSLSDNIYYGKGVTWLFNGLFSPKSAGEVISCACFINKYARDNYEMLINEYTEPDVSEGFRRYWKSFDSMMDFYSRFFDQVYSETPDKDNFGNYGLVREPEKITPIGDDWYSIYYSIERRIHSIFESKISERIPELASILIDSGAGAVSPRTLLEYDLDSKKLLDAFRYYLNDSPRSIEAFSQIDMYISSVCESFSDYGRFPKRDLSVEDRKDIYKKLISSDYRELLDSVVANWECAYTETVVSSIKNDFSQCLPSGRNKKIGVLGISRFSLEKIEFMLKNVYNDNNILIQIIDSKTTPEELSAISKNHINERFRNVVTLCTASVVGKTFLPSDKIYRFTSWNPSRGHQYESLFHRSDSQSATVSVIIPDGIARYLRELEGRKGLMSYASSVLFDANDSGDEMVTSSLSLNRFMDKLRHYRPRVMYV
jgi:hypothetical protein